MSGQPISGSFGVGKTEKVNYSEEMVTGAPLLKRKQLDTPVKSKEFSTGSVLSSFGSVNTKSDFKGLMKSIEEIRLGVAQEKGLEAMEKVTKVIEAKIFTREHNESTGVPLIDNVRNTGMTTIEVISPEKRTYTLDTGKLTDLTTKGLDWSAYKPNGSENLKNLRKEAILDPAAFNTANDLLTSIVEKGGTNCQLKMLKDGSEAEGVGRDYKFSLEYNDKDGNSQKISLRFFAPGSNTNTSDIDLSITVIPPNMFTEVWKAYDKNANDCLKDLNTQITKHSSNLPVTQSLAKAFDINLYSPGFSNIGEGVSPVFETKTKEGLQTVRTIDLGLGMVRTVAEIAKNESLAEIELAKMTTKPARYQKSFDFALKIVEKNFIDEGYKIIQLAKENKIENPKLALFLETLISIKIYNPIRILDSPENLKTTDRKNILSNIKNIMNQMNDLKEISLSDGTNLLETAKKEMFLECHLEVEKCINNKNTKTISEIDADEQTIFAHIAQGRGTMYADEAYNNATSIHKIVEGRQQGKVQYQTELGAVSSIESDFGFLLHHQQDNSDKFLNSSAKYLNRIMDQATTIDIKTVDEPLKNIKGNQLTISSLKNWTEDLEFIKNFNPKNLKSQEKMQEILTKIFGEIDPILKNPNRFTTINKEEICNKLTNLEIFREWPPSTKLDLDKKAIIMDIMGDVREYSISSLDKKSF